MKVLITGGAGFIGKNLAKRMLAEGHEVLVFDNFENSKPDDVPQGAKVIFGDVRKKEDARKVSGADVVVHLAAKISVPDSVKNPTETFETNFHGTINLLEENMDANFVFASSAAIYGFQEKMPIAETAKPNPLSPYGLSKLFCENYFDYIRKTYGGKISTLRFFNIYGQGQKNNQYAGVIVKFLEAARAGHGIEIFGDGLQTRDFVNVADVCAAIEMSAGKSGTWNIGSGKSITINELAEIIKKISGADLKITHVAERPGEIKHSLADISRAGKDLGWNPSINFERGLRELF